jgi:hypothetical protein
MPASPAKRGARLGVDDGPAVTRAFRGAADAVADPGVLMDLVDRGFLGLTVVYLAFVALLPFPTGVLGEFGPTRCRWPPSRRT